MMSSIFVNEKDLPRIQLPSNLHYSYLLRTGGCKNRHFNIFPVKLVVDTTKITVMTFVLLLTIIMVQSAEFLSNSLGLIKLTFIFSEIPCILEQSTTPHNYLTELSRKSHRTLTSVRCGLCPVWEQSPIVE